MQNFVILAQTALEKFDNFGAETVSGVISGMFVDQTGTDVRVKFGAIPDQTVPDSVYEPLTL